MTTLISFKISELQAGRREREEVFLPFPEGQNPSPPLSGALSNLFPPTNTVPKYYYLYMCSLQDGLGELKA